MRYYDNIIKEKPGSSFKFTAEKNDMELKIIDFTEFNEYIDNFTNGCGEVFLEICENLFYDEENANFDKYISFFITDDCYKSKILGGKIKLPDEREKISYIISKYRSKKEMYKILSQKGIKKSIFDSFFEDKRKTALEILENNLIDVPGLIFFEREKVKLIIKSYITKYLTDIRNAVSHLDEETREDVLFAIEERLPNCIKNDF